jgi:predicted nuclease of restriction endonuclease-like (RecB) superfamily
MDYYLEIKNELIENEITKKAKDYSKNKSDLMHYYNVGKLIVDAHGGEQNTTYGNSLIKEYSKMLTIELGKGYSWRNLYNMRTYYLLLSRNTKLQALPAILSWSHIVELLPIHDVNEITYYIGIVEKQNISYRKLHDRIKSKEYQRLDTETKDKLISNEKTTITDYIKNPIIIRNNLNIEEISEKYLKRIILENVIDFMEQLGEGFSFIKDEYKIKIGDKFNYIDLLLFNVEFNCYVVVELKVTELKKEHIGQIEVYMNYIDKHIKKIYHNKTIGIIICKRDNKLLLEYCSDARIVSREYVLN